MMQQTKRKLVLEQVRPRARGDVSRQRCTDLGQQTCRVLCVARRAERLWLWHWVPVCSLQECLLGGSRSCGNRYGTWNALATAFSRREASGGYAICVLVQDGAQ